MLRQPPTSTLFPYTTLFRSTSAMAPFDGTPSTVPSTTTAGAPPSVVAAPASRSLPGVPLKSTSTASAACCRSEEHTSELQSHVNLVCRLLLEKKNKKVQVSS